MNHAQACSQAFFPGKHAPVITLGPEKILLGKDLFFIQGLLPLVIGFQKLHLLMHFSIFLLEHDKVIAFHRKQNVSLSNSFSFCVVNPPHPSGHQGVNSCASPNGCHHKAIGRNLIAEHLPGGIPHHHSSLFELVFGNYNLTGYGCFIIRFQACRSFPRSSTARKESDQ